jgi:hypothetical protein
MTPSITLLTFIERYDIDIFVLQKSSSGCLADLCPIFGCDKGLSAHDYKERARAELCTRQTVDKYQFRCRVLMNRSCADIKKEITVTRSSRYR